MIEFLISFINAINIGQLVLTFGMCRFIVWKIEKGGEQRRKKCQDLEQTDLAESNQKTHLEQNTKLWWNLEGWKMDDGDIGPELYIPGKEKIHKLTEEEWTGK